MLKDMDVRINPKNAQGNYDPNYLLSLVLDLGEEMLADGAEINRVEDSIYRMISAYGFRKVNVFSIPEFISVSFMIPDGTMVSETRRVYKLSNNFYRLEELNELSRYICSNQPTVQEIWDLSEQISSVSYSKKLWITGIAYFMGGSGFTVFFGGNLMDGLAAGLTALLIMMFDRYSHIQNMNKIVHTAICAFAAGLCALFLCHGLHIGSHLDTIMIGDIMLLIPGMALTTSIRDMLCGDIVAGLMRFCESILIAGAIALGYAIPIFIFGGML